MATLTRVPPESVRDRDEAESPLLVCSYDDDQKCAGMKVPGAITYREFQSRLGEIAPDREIVFYCG